MRGSPPFILSESTMCGRASELRRNNLCTLLSFYSVRAQMSQNQFNDSVTAAPPRAGREAPHHRETGLRIGVPARGDELGTTHSKIQCQRKTNRPIMYSTASARPKLTTAIEPEQLWPSQSQLQRRLRDALLGAGAIHLRAQARQRVQPRQPHACFESKEDGVRGEPRRTVPGAATRRETVEDGRSNEEAVRGGRRGCGALSEEAQSRYRTCLGGRLYRAPRLA